MARHEDDASRYRRLMTEALVELESLQAHVERLRRAASEPIAVIGMGCRLPSGANDPAAFWTLLRDGVDAVREVPAERWDVDAYYSADTSIPGTVYCRHAALLEQAVVERFSPEFFGIAPREAERMDPQQRMLLEVCWEALEDAGLPADRVRGSRTGMFVGSCTDDYLQLFNNLADPAHIDGYSSLGTARCITVGRVAYFLGLEGPAIQLDTACSSSLVAVHQACASLRSGECDTALAGGVNLQLSAAWTIGLCKLKALAPDGRCKTFDIAADGFGRGEGCGIVVLRRLSDAVTAADPIRAVIRGSAVNHDGRSSGLTVPSQAAQEKLIRQAHQAAAVGPDEIDYLEAHGTGTALGDPIEMSALASIFRGHRQTLWVGSVKTNIGHLEAAAGIAGMLKVILALGHETIPPHLHFRQPNPDIPWSDFPARIPNSPIPWPRGERPRLAGVSSFGFSGTNAHVILQEAASAGTTAGTSRTYHVLPLSAKSHGSLRELASRYLERLERDAVLRLGDVCFTAAVGRTRFPYRLAVIAGSSPQACQLLRAWLRDEPTPNVLFNVAEQTADGSMLPAWPRPADLERQEVRGLVSLAAERFVQGLPMDWDVFYRGVDCRKIALPVYPFERQRYWLAPSPTVSPVAPSAAEPGEQPLLGRRVHTVATPEVLLFETTLGPHKPRYLADHCLHDTVILPATAFLELAAASGRIQCPDSAVVVGQLAIHQALTLTPDESRIVQTLLTPEPSGYRVEVFSRRSWLDGSERLAWVRHASARVASFERFHRVVSIDAQRGKCTQEVAREAVYGRIARQGWRYGPSFQLLRQVWRGSGEALGEIVAPEGFSFGSQGDGFPPQLLDACLHVIAALDETDRVATLVPVALDRFEAVGRAVPRMWSHVVLRAAGDATLTSGLTADIDVLDPNGLLIARLEGLRLREVDPEVLTSRPEGESPVGLYELQWRESQRAAATAADGESGCWLFLADEGGLAEALAQRLVERGDECVLIQAGDDYRLSGPKSESIRRGCVRRESPADFAALFRDLCPDMTGGQVAKKLRGVAHLWSLDLMGDSSDALAACHRFGCGSALHLVHAMTAVATPARLWLVTRGSQDVHGSSLGAASLGQAPLWGFGAVVVVEHPDVRCVRVDLDPAIPGALQVEALLAELTAPDAEDQIAYRRSFRYTPRLVRGAAGKHSLSLDRGTILITGGLGDLGLQVAGWLVAHGARHLVLSGRHDPQTDRQRDTLDVLRRGGVEVRVVSADLSSRADVERLVETVRQTMPPLCGVIHAAGLLEDGVLRRLDWAQFERVLLPKTTGAWHLHELAGEVDFFVLFSSAVGLLGAPGQANYAAANAFLDALARYRRALGLSATSIAWGPWEIGMTARAGDALRTRLASSGIRLIRSDNGLGVLESALAQPVPYVVALDVDWDRLSAHRPGNSLWAELVRPSGTRVPGPAPWVEQIERTPPANRMGFLVGLLRSEIASVLGWESPDRVGIKQNLFDLGMDSITSVELQSRLATCLGISLPLTLAFDRPNVRSLAEYIAQRLNVNVETSFRRDDGGELPEDVQQVAAMSDEEVKALVLEKYKQLL